LIDDEEKKFWLVESGWGESWGENGVGKVAMSDDCLIGEFSLAIKVEKSEPVKK